MLDVYLVPANTVITAKGDSEAFDLSPAGSRVFLLTLTISAMVEQEGIDITLFTSADGTTWEATPAGSLNQKFYVGDYPLLVDLSAQPDVKFVRAHWEVSRWGRGSLEPRFEIALRLREVSLEALREAEAEAHTRSF